jgi:hypothetical protein
MSPRRGSKPGLTDRLVVGRKVTLTFFDNELVSDGKGRHKSQLAAKQRVQQLWVQQLQVSIRAEQQSSEKSCKVAGERILRYWKRGNEWRYGVKTRQVL